MEPKPTIFDGYQPIVVGPYEPPPEVTPVNPPPPELVVAAQANAGKKLVVPMRFGLPAELTGAGVVKAKLTCKYSKDGAEVAKGPPRGTGGLKGLMLEFKSTNDEEHDDETTGQRPFYNGVSGTLIFTDLDPGTRVEMRVKVEEVPDGDVENDDTIAFFHVP